MAKKLWGGRFSKKTDPLLEEFSSSLDVDKELALYDVAGSCFHVSVLKEANLISAAEYRAMYGGLKQIFQAIKSGTFKVDESSEDIHSDIQNKLEKKIGTAALKLHAARSRNDQIVFDVKFYCKESCAEAGLLAIDLLERIQGVIDKSEDLILPGYTHLQHAQSISLKNYFSAYLEMLARDAERLKNLAVSIRPSLGSGALAGTNIDADKYAKAIKNVCKQLGLVYDKHIFAVENSVDNVSDRDFVIEALSALAIIGMHLSRLCEDLIIWSTKEFGFIELDDAFCTGSSLMPQKKNPDSLELIRGNTGKLYGNLMSVLTMMKGLPLTYNRDMQLDKEPLFSSFKIIKDELKILAKLIPTIKFNKAAIEKQLEDESLYATDLAHYLVEKGIAFKDAHTIIGNLVRFSLKNNIAIKKMSDEELAQFSKYLNQGVIKKIFDPVYSVKSKKSVKPRKLK